jgi:four helix bundle protein
VRKLGRSLAQAAISCRVCQQASDSEGEAAETQVWIQFAVECGYLDRAEARRLYSEYDEITGMLVSIIHNPTPWLIK